MGLAMLKMVLLREGSLILDMAVAPRVSANFWSKSNLVLLSTNSEASLAFCSMICGLMLSKRWQLQFLRSVTRLMTMNLPRAYTQCASSISTKRMTLGMTMSMVSRMWAFMGPLFRERNRGMVEQMALVSSYQNWHWWAVRGRVELLSTMSKLRAELGAVARLVSGSWMQSEMVRKFFQLETWREVLWVLQSKVVQSWVMLPTWQKASMLSMRALTLVRAESSDCSLAACWAWLVFSWVLASLSRRAALVTCMMNLWSLLLADEARMQVYDIFCICTMHRMSSTSRIRKMTMARMHRHRTCCCEPSLAAVEQASLTRSSSLRCLSFSSWASLQLVPVFSKVCATISSSCMSSNYSGCLQLSTAECVNGRVFVSVNSSMEQWQSLWSNSLSSFTPSLVFSFSPSSMFVLTSATVTVLRIPLMSWSQNWPRQALSKPSEEQASLDSPDTQAILRSGACFMRKKQYLTPSVMEGISWIRKRAGTIFLLASNMKLSLCSMYSLSSVTKRSICLQCHWCISGISMSLMVLTLSNFWWASSAKKQFLSTTAPQFSVSTDMKQTGVSDSREKAFRFSEMRSFSMSFLLWLSSLGGAMMWREDLGAMLSTIRQQSEVIRLMTSSECLKARVMSWQVSTMRRWPRSRLTIIFMSLSASGSLLPSSFHMLAVLWAERRSILRYFSTWSWNSTKRAAWVLTAPSVLQRWVMSSWTQQLMIMRLSSNHRQARRLSVMSSWKVSTWQQAVMARPSLNSWISATLTTSRWYLLNPSFISVSPSSRICPRLQCDSMQLIRNQYHTFSSRMSVSRLPRCSTTRPHRHSTREHRRQCSRMKYYSFSAYCWGLHRKKISSLIWWTVGCCSSSIPRMRQAETHSTRAMEPPAPAIHTRPGVSPLLAASQMRARAAKATTLTTARMTLWWRQKVRGCLKAKKTKTGTKTAARVSRRGSLLTLATAQSTWKRMRMRQMLRALSFWTSWGVSTKVLQCLTTTSGSMPATARTAATEPRLSMPGVEGSSLSMMEALRRGIRVKAWQAVSRQTKMTPRQP